MDFRTVSDKKALAIQLRKPEGEYGLEVAKVMAGRNNEVTAFTIECINLQPADHVLEIGFGPGEGIAQCVQITTEGFVAGLDYSEDMLTMAQERNHRALMQEKAELTLGEANAMPYSDEEFHKVFGVNVFHFWEDPSNPLAECLRVLKPGGKIAFFMSYPSSWIPGLAETGIFIPREPEDVETLLMDAGFTHAKSRSFTLDQFNGFTTMAEKQ